MFERHLEYRVGRHRMHRHRCTGLLDEQRKHVEPAERPRPQPAEPVEEFVPVRQVLASPGFLTLAAAASQFSKSPWWYIQWTPQRLRLTRPPRL